MMEVDGKPALVGIRLKRAAAGSSRPSTWSRATSARLRSPTRRRRVRRLLREVPEEYADLTRPAAPHRRELL
jgi:hypothetical protein